LNPALKIYVDTFTTESITSYNFNSMIRKPKTFIKKQHNFLTFLPFREIM